MHLKEEMVKIIKHGDPDQDEGGTQVTCGKCNTVFVYIKHDVRLNKGSYSHTHFGEEAHNDRTYYQNAHEYVSCPVCGASYITKWIGERYD